MSDFAHKRLLGLDIVRALAIILVLLSHGRTVLPSPESTLFLSFGGKMGVELFFVLSGFLIGSILLRLCDAGLTIKFIRHFWLRRWMRTLPAYLFVLFFLFLFYGTFDPLYLIFLQEYSINSYDLFPVSWSLAIEEWFYLLFPLLCLCMIIFAPKRGFLLSALALIIVPFLWQITQLSACESAEHILRCQDDVIRKFTFRFTNIAMGALLAYLHVRRGLNNLLANKLRSFKPISLMVFLGISAYSIHLILLNDNATALQGFFMLPLMGIASVFLIALMMVWEPNVPAWLTKAITFVSLTSYSNYLWHHFYVEQLHDAFPERSAIMFMIYLIGAFILAAASYYGVERPFLKWREHLPQARTQAKTNS